MQLIYKVSDYDIKRYQSILEERLENIDSAIEHKFHTQSMPIIVKDQLEDLMIQDSDKRDAMKLKLWKFYTRMS